MRFGTALTYAAFPDGGGVSRPARSARVSQLALNINSERMRAAEHAPRDPFHVLQRRHGLAEIVECGAGVEKESLRVIPPHPERGLVILTEDASRHGQCSMQQ